MLDSNIVVQTGSNLVYTLVMYPNSYYRYVNYKLLREFFLVSKPSISSLFAHERATKRQQQRDANYTSGTWEICQKLNSKIPANSSSQVVYHTHRYQASHYPID